MSYDYAKERPALFTDEGQRKFLAIRDRAKYLLKEAGAFRAEEAMRGALGSSWETLACIDRLLELGEIKECSNPVSSWAQHRLFTGSTRP